MKKKKVKIFFFLFPFQNKKEKKKMSFKKEKLKNKEKKAPSYLEEIKIEEEWREPLVSNNATTTTTAIPFKSHFLFFLFTER